MGATPRLALFGDQDASKCQKSYALGRWDWASSFGESRDVEGPFLVVAQSSFPLDWISCDDGGGLALLALWKA